MTSVLIGLDPSPLRLGWGAVDLDTGHPIACGTEKLWKAPDERLAPGSVRQALRAVDFFHLNDAEIALVYVEAGFIGLDPNVAINIAEAMGQTVQAANRRWPHAPIQRLKPAEWRHAAGLKGNASKAECARRAVELGFMALDQDAADAALIATAGWHTNQAILEQAGAA